MSTRLAKKKILLLEDDRHFRDLVVPLLMQMGHSVVEASTGRQGSVALTKDVPDLIIVDGKLPDIDGAEWIASIRNRGVDTPVVYVSLFRQDGRFYRRLTEDLSVRRIIHKPVIPVVFREQVEMELIGSTHVVTEVDRETKEKLATLYLNYAKELPGKVDDLEFALNQLKDQPDEPFMMSEVKGQLHRLKGTSGSFGYSDIAGTIEEIDQELPKIVGSDGKTRTQIWLSVDQKIANLRILARQAANIRDIDLTSEKISKANAVASVLVVDNDTDFLTRVCELGAKRMLDVVTATSPETAMEQARGRHLDAALIDVGIGRADSCFALARVLRGLPGYETLPIGFSTSQQRQDNRVAAAHAGASLFLNKPLDPDTFDDCVQKLISLRQVERSKVLIVGDDEALLHRITLLLTQEGVLVKEMNNSLNIIQEIEEFQPDLLIIDVTMPGISGFDVCRMVRVNPRWHELPVLFLTAQLGLDSRLAAFEAGGDDYMNKPIVDQELATRVKVRLERAKLKKERDERDPTTGLLLRRAFVDKLTTMLAESTRQKMPLSLCILDIDNFRKINSTYGHLAGDGVLAEVGKLLTRRFRAEDLRGRWAGEEFILAFRNADKDVINGAILRSQAEFQRMAFYSDQGETFRISMSAGISSYPQDASNLFDLIKVADQKLQKAKQAGGSRVAC